MTRERGRPAGYLINPEAARYVLGDRKQTWLAVEADISTSHLNGALSGTKGCTADIAQRIADALAVPVGVLFPELVQFRTTVRHFTAPKVTDEDAGDEAA